jgi:hypothetical protein
MDGYVNTIYKEISGFHLSVGLYLHPVFTGVGRFGRSITYLSYGIHLLYRVGIP